MIIYLPREILLAAGCKFLFSTIHGMYLLIQAGFGDCSLSRKIHRNKHWPS